ncbi:unnamed protein product [Closterium sp. NIES-53]
MEVACTSMIHAAAPHFMWLFAVRYAAHQLNLWLRVSLPETSPTVRWTGKVGDASVFQVLGSCAFVRDTSADKLSSRAIPSVFLGFPPDAPGRQLYHPISCHFLPSQDITFDELGSFYRLFPYCTSPLPPPPLFLALGPPPPSGSCSLRTLPSFTVLYPTISTAGPRSVSQVDPFPLAEPVEVIVDSRAARDAASGGVEPAGVEPGSAESASAEPGGAELEGAEPGGAKSKGAEPGGAEPTGAVPGGAEPEGAEPGGAESEGAEFVGAEPRGTSSSGGPAVELPELEALPLEALELEVLELVVLEVLEFLLELEVPEVLELLVLEELVLGLLELPGLVVLGALELEELELETLALEALGLEALEMEALELEALELETLALEALRLEVLELEEPELETLALEALELEALALATLELEELELEALALEALELLTLELEVLALGVLCLAVLVLEALCSGARFSFCRSRCLCRHLTRYSQTPQCLLLLLTLSRHTLLQSLESLSLVLPRLFALFVLVVGFLVRIPGTYAMALRPSSVPLRVPLPPPPESSLPTVPDRESDLARAPSPTVSCLLATVVTDPSFDSTAASALVVGLIDFAAAYRLDYATALVVESESASPPSVGGECALGTDVLEDRQEDFECLAAAVPHLVAMLLALEGDPDAPDIPTPRSFAEGITGPYSSQFRTAMDAEMASWKSTGTYVKRPPGSPPVFNARYVARGFSQRQGVDFFHTFSPTPNMTTLRVLLHVAAQRDYELHSHNFRKAFLQGSVHEEIWLRRPPSFTGSFLAGTQWSLQRRVYGFRQAPHEWHDTLRTTLAALGFAPSTADPSLFLRTDTSLPPFYIAVYVDDLVFATADTEALALLKTQLQKRHTCTNLGELRSYLGLQITRDRARRTITLTQSRMVHQVLQRFSFRYSSPLSTPLPTGHSLSAPPSDESVRPSGPYPELVGCLMYLITYTRPGLAYLLSILARYVAPERDRLEHWEAVKRVLRYLCSTLGMGLVLGGRGLVVLIGHAGASWVDDLATQRSSLGYTFSLGSGSVSWRSTHLSSVLSSSCEAEIYAGAMAAQELRWLTYLLTDLGE